MRAFALVDEDLLMVEDEEGKSRVRRVDIRDGTPEPLLESGALDAKVDVSTRWAREPRKRWARGSELRAQRYRIHRVATDRPR